MTPMTAAERLARLRDRLTEAIADLADIYDPRSPQARDVDTGPAWDGLYAQLTRSLGLPGAPTESGSHANKPGSRPPGWRSDVSALISTIDTTVKGWKPGGKTTIDGLRNLPYITDDADIADRAQIVSGWVSRATLAIGYRQPSKPLPDVRCEKRHYTRHGWRDVGCKQVSLRVREGGTVVWCSTPECHDSVLNPDCTHDEAGAWSCRDSDGDRTHAVTFTKDEWLFLWEEKQQREQEALAAEPSAVSPPIAAST